MPEKYELPEEEKKVIDKGIDTIKEKRSKVGPMLSELEQDTIEHAKKHQKTNQIGDWAKRYQRKTDLMAKIQALESYWNNYTHFHAGFDIFGMFHGFGQLDKIEKMKDYAGPYWIV